MSIVKEILNRLASIAMEFMHFIKSVWISINLMLERIKETMVSSIHSTPQQLTHTTQGSLWSMCSTIINFCIAHKKEIKDLIKTIPIVFKALKTLFAPLLLKAV